MSTPAAPQSPRRPRLSLDVSLDTWAVIAATALVLAIVIGTLPRVPW
jgi:hypothetical protein